MASSSAGSVKCNNAEWLKSFSSSVTQAPEVASINGRASRQEAASNFVSALVRLLVFVLLAWTLFHTVLGVDRVSGSGMRPTMGDGDLVLTERPIAFGSDLLADDLVVWSKDGKSGIGRVVGLPGDTVEVTDDGQFLVNGSAQPSRSGETTEPQGGSGVQYPLTLGDGEWFVLGDGRGSAADSREVGPIGIDGVEGKVVACLRLRQI